MATLIAGQSASFFIDSFWTIEVSASKASGTLAFASSAENLRSSFTSGLQSKVYGPFGAPGTVTITVAEGSIVYTLTRIDEVGGRTDLTYATLPDPTLYPEGTQGYTSDEGLVVQRSGGWVAVGGEAATWGGIDGDLPDQSDLWAALGGTTFGGASDETIDDYDDDTGVADSIVIDGLTWALVYYTDGRLNTATSGALVREYVYDGQNRYIGVNGVKIQGGALVLTFAQMIALTPTVSGLRVKLSDTYPGAEFIYDGAGYWKSPAGRFRFAGSGLERILLGGSGATYSQTGTTVTVSLTAHGLTAAVDNGASVYLTQSTGALVSGWFTNVTYVDANSFTCTSTVSQSTSGNLGTQTGEITVDTLTLKGKMLGPNGELSGWLFATANANNANAKTLRLKFGGSTVLNPSLASTVTAHVPFRLQNRANAAKQIGFSTSSTSQSGSTTAAPNPYTVDTESDVTVLITMQLATATDHMKLCGYALDVLQG